MFQCNTLYCNTKCSLCSPLAKGYVPPCTCIFRTIEVILQKDVIRYDCPFTKSPSICVSGRTLISSETVTDEFCGGEVYKKEPMDFGVI